jgi:hypothetical protein
MANLAEANPGTGDGMPVAFFAFQRQQRFQIPDMGIMDQPDCLRWSQFLLMASAPDPIVRPYRVPW